MRDYSLYLKDIIDAMEAVEKFIEGMDFPAFQSDDLISSTVLFIFILESNTILFGIQ